MHNGFVRALLVSNEFVLGKPQTNIDIMLSIAKQSKGDFLVFPELSTTGYSMEDLFYHQDLLQASNQAIAHFIKQNPFQGIVVLGAPITWENVIYNCAVVLQGNRILGIIPKMYLPHTGEFYETRWFVDGEGIQTTIDFCSQLVPFGTIVFDTDDYSFGVEVCADMWGPVNPSSNLYLAGAEVVINISSSPEVVDKGSMRRILANAISYRHKGAYLYVSSNANESSSTVLFSGDTFVSQMGEVIAEDASLGFATKVVPADIDISYLQYIRRSNGWFRQARKRTALTQARVPFAQVNQALPLLQPLNRTPFLPTKHIDSFVDQVRTIQRLSLQRRLHVLPKPSVVMGLSGGLDSSLALLVAVAAFDHAKVDRKHIHAFWLPTKHSSATTKDSSRRLAQQLGVSFAEVDLQGRVDLDLSMLGHHAIDVTYENVQARARTNFLMNKANQVGGIVLGTSDMTEIALGWSTFAGDQIAHYGVNAGIPKTLVRFLLHAEADRVPALRDVLQQITATTISPELTDNQSSEAIIGTFEVNDLLLYRFLKYGDDATRLTQLFPEYKEQIQTFFRRFEQGQFKRNSMPDAVKILFSALSPSADWRMPSDLL
jgi:NAD+ synthase (glutamine-hydrolysing)